MSECWADDAQGGKGAAGRAERDMMRTKVLEDAAIVCSTLSFSGSGAFGSMARPFDVVIIDEAAQAVEPSILIPLTAGCKQVIICPHNSQKDRSAQVLSSWVSADVSARVVWQTMVPVVCQRRVA